MKKCMCHHVSSIWVEGNTGYAKVEPSRLHSFVQNAVWSVRGNDVLILCVCVCEWRVSAWSQHVLSWDTPCLPCLWLVLWTKKETKESWFISLFLSFFSYSSLKLRSLSAFSYIIFNLQKQLLDCIFHPVFWNSSFSSSLYCSLVEDQTNRDSRHGSNWKT